MPAIEDQRVCFSVFEAQNTTDDDLMITAIVNILRPALEHSRELRQNRHARNTIMTINAVELIGTAGRKSRANFFLINAQHVDSKVLRLHERVEVSGIKVDAPEDQRRIQ